MSTRHVMPAFCIALALLLAAGCGGREDSPEASFEAGLAHAEKGSWEAAIAAYGRAVEGRPNWVDAYVNRGVAKAALGDHAGAIKDYDEALRLDPKATDALVNRGVARHELGQYDEAARDYTEALEVDELDLDAYRNRALTFRAAGELDAAVEDYGFAVRISPDDLNLYRERAAVRREQEDEDAAAVDDMLEQLTAAIAAAPEDHGPRRQRGLAFFEVGEYVLALSDLSEAIRLAPDHADTYVARAHAWYIQGHSDKAIEDYTQALERNVEAASEAYAARGNAYESLGNTPKAVADYTKAVDLDPEDEDTAMQLAWILATDPIAEHRDGKRAVELASRAVALTEERHWRALDVMAAACAEKGDLAGAAEYAQRSLRLVPQDQQKAVQERLALYNSGKPYHEGKE